MNGWGRPHRAWLSSLNWVARSLPHVAQFIVAVQAHRVPIARPLRSRSTGAMPLPAMLQINVVATVAQFERESVSERVNFGSAVLQGKRAFA